MRRVHQGAPELLQPCRGVPVNLRVVGSFGLRIVQEAFQAGPQPLEVGREKCPTQSRRERLQVVKRGCDGGDVFAPRCDLLGPFGQRRKDANRFLADLSCERSSAERTAASTATSAILGTSWRSRSSERASSIRVETCRSTSPFSMREICAWVRCARALRSR